VIPWLECALGQDVIFLSDVEAPIKLSLHAIVVKKFASNVEELIMAAFSRLVINKEIGNLRNGFEEKKYESAQCARLILKKVPDVTT